MLEMVEMDIKLHVKGMFLGHILWSKLYEFFDTDTHHMAHLTKLKLSIWNCGRLYSRI
jgi:hypothetical protein